MGKMSLCVYMKGDYEEFYALGRRKNKANSKPIRRLALRPELGIEKSKQVGNIIDSSFPPFGQRFDRCYHNDPIFYDVTKPVIAAGNG